MTKLKTQTRTPELGTLPAFLERPVAQLKAEYATMAIIRANAENRHLVVYADKSPEAVSAAGRSSEEWFWDWDFRAQFLVDMSENFKRFFEHCNTIGLDDIAAQKYLHAAGVPERFTADLARAREYLNSERSFA